MLFDGYVLDSGRPYSLCLCLLGYPTGLPDDFVVRRRRDSHRLLRQAEEQLAPTFGLPPVIVVNGWRLGRRWNQGLFSRGFHR